jgi:Tfp pilus assembly PilM family ATPase/Tfp pilus assembly protein PilN
MLLKSKSILAIEISPQQVNIIEGVRSARQPKIINCIQIPDPPQAHDLLAQKIAAVIKERGIKTKAAHLAVFHPHIEQHYLRIPPLSKKELRQVVKREVKKMKDRLLFEFPQDSQENDEETCEPYFDYQVLGEVEEQKRKRRGLLLAVALRRVVDEYTRLLEKAELEPRLITGVPLAMANALALAVPAAKDTSRETVAFLYLMPDKGLLNIVSQGSWRFFRQLPLRISRPGGRPGKASAGDVKAADLSADAIDYDQLLLELNRSFLYFTQQERGKQVSSVVISSVWGTSTDQGKDFAERLHVPVSLFDPTERLNLGNIAEPAVGWAQFLNSLPVPLGLLVDSGVQTSINLLPWRVREHKKHLASNLLIGFTAIGYAILVGAGYVGLRWAQENYRQAMMSQQQNVDQLRPAFEQSQKAWRERRERDFHLSILKRFERASPLWRGVFYELSRLTPPGLLFSSMEITEDKGLWRLQADGVISASTSMRAQKTLKRFLNRLERAVFFSRPRVSNIKFSPYQSGKREDEADVMQSRLDFSLSCNIRY